FMILPRSRCTLFPYTTLFRSGLGEQICYEAAKKGAIVVVCARRIQKIGQVKEKCQSLSQKAAFAFQLDISDPASVERMYQRLKEDRKSTRLNSSHVSISYAVF